MKKQLMIIPLFIATSFVSFGQDYLEDLKGNENQVSLAPRDNVYKSQGFRTNWNIGARVNVGDNSVKMNTFGILRHTSKVGDNKKTVTNKEIKEDFTNSAGFTAASNYIFNSFGFGSSIKAKTESGLGSFFSKGEFTPSTQAGAYLFWKKVSIESDVHKYTFVVNPFFNVNFASYQIVPSYTSYTFNKQDTSLTGWNGGMTAYYLCYAGKSQVTFGLTATVSKLNNYKDMDKVELKETMNKVDTVTGQQTNMTKVNDNGYEYGVGNLKTYMNTNIKAYFTYIPAQFDYRMAIVLYPSVDFNDLYDKPGVNMGLGIHFLQKEDPGLTIAGLLFEFNDINNSKSKDLPFATRSFKVGAIVALNIAGLVKK